MESHVSGTLWHPSHVLHGKGVSILPSGVCPFASTGTPKRLPTCRMLSRTLRGVSTGTVVRRDESGRKRTGNQPPPCNSLLKKHNPSKSAFMEGFICLGDERWYQETVPFYVPMPVTPLSMQQPKLQAQLSSLW